MKLGIRGEAGMLLLALAGVAVACSGQVSGGAQYDTCLGSVVGSGCVACVRTNCASDLNAIEQGCSDFLGCACTGPGGSYDSASAASATCQPKVEEPSCNAAAGNSPTMYCQACDSACSATSSSSSGSSGSSSGVVSSSSSSGSGSTSGSSSGGGDQCAQLPPSTCNEPPTPPGGQTTSSTTAHEYAVHTLYLGDTDRSGVMNPDAWKAFGYDLDGKITNAASTDVCTLVTGASKQVQIDGNGGIDNSWGANIMPIWETLDSTFSQTVNTDIQAGGPTQLFYTVGFDDSAGNTTTAVGLSGVTLAGAQVGADGGPPTWNLGTHWPIDPTSINGCANGCPAGTDPIQGAIVKFPSAFQVQGAFVSGSPTDLQLTLGLAGQALRLNLHGAVVTFDPQMPGSVTNGTIAGVLDTQEMIAALKTIAGRISTSLCSGSAFQSIADQIQQTSDIVVSGTQVNNAPGSVCNAISIGIGFDATEIALPTPADIAPPQPPPPDPCAGTDGG
ncbi:MAG TPA: hypothetical protein VF765_08745 [Polyangiaceae bacterium]